jgi:hypothetical protein
MESELTNSEKIVHNIINKNKYIIGCIVVLISFYLSNYINNITDVVNIIDNPIIKVLLFLFISYYTMDNPTIGMILLIIILVIFQIVSNLKIKNDINADLQIDKFKILSETNLLDTKINKVKQEKHLKKLKEKNPEYLTEFNKLINNYLNKPDLMLAYNEFKINYEKLQILNLTQEQYYINLINFYQSKLYLLKLIFKYKKDTMDKEKVEQITKLINEIKEKGIEKEKDNNLIEKIGKIFDLFE